MDVGEGDGLHDAEAPAADTAATSSGLLHGYIGPQIRVSPPGRGSEKANGLVL